MFLNLVAGSVLVAATVCIHGLGLLALSALLRHTIGRYRPHRTLSATIVVMVATVLGLFVLHTIEIWVWAAAYLMVGALPDFTSALVFSTLSFSTLGAEDVSAIHSWQLFGSIEGVNGFLLIGWSTAYLIPAWTRYGPFHEERGF
jgi:Ion channel